MKTPPHIGASASTLDTTEWYVVDQVEPARSSILCGEGKTAMSELMKEMASTSFIYDLDIRNLVEDYELGTRKDLSVKLYLNLLPYEGIKILITLTVMCSNLTIWSTFPRFRGDVMKPGVHAHVSRFAVQSDPGIRLSLRKRGKCEPISVGFQIFRCLKIGERKRRAAAGF